MLSLVDNQSTMEEMVKFFELVIEFVKQTKEMTEKEVENLRLLYEKALSKVESTQTEQFSDLKNHLLSYCEKEINKITSDHNQKMSLIDSKMESIKDGKDADEENIIKSATEAVLANMPPVKELEPETPEQVRDKLESLKEEARLDKTAIKGLEDIIKDLENKISSIPRGGGGFKANNAMKFYKLTPDSSTKIFTVPKSVTSIVLMSDFPNILFEGSANGFTLNSTRTELTLTVVNAPTTDSQLLYAYSSMFN